MKFDSNQVRNSITHIVIGDITAQELVSLNLIAISGCSQLQNLLVLFVTVHRMLGKVVAEQRISSSVRLHHSFRHGCLPSDNKILTTNKIFQ